MIPCEDQFYALDADLFHIATHPEQREGVLPSPGTRQAGQY